MTQHSFLDDDLRDQAAQYVLGLLPDMEARSMRLHLARCHACRTEVESLVDLSRDLCLLYPTEKPPEQLWLRVVERISEVDPRLSLSSDLHGNVLDVPARSDEVREKRESIARVDERAGHRNARTESMTTAHPAQIWKAWARTPSDAPARDFTFVPSAAGDWQPTSISGIDARRLFLDADHDRATFLVRMAPGSAYPAHVHAGPEECFVLEGDLEVGELCMRTGDYQRAEPGSTHGVQSTQEGCLLLIVSSLEDEIIG